MLDLLIAYLFTQYGIVAVLIVLILVLVLHNPSIISHFVSYIYTLLKKENPVYNGSEVLKSKLIYWLEFKLDAIQVSDNKARNLIYKDMIRILLQEYQNKIFKLEDEENVNNLSKTEIYTNTIQILSDIKISFETRCKKEGIPDIVISKFDHWMLRNMEFFYNNLSLICISDIYVDNFKRIQTIYYICVSVLEITLTEAEKTLKDINGQLNGIEYKGHDCTIDYECKYDVECNIESIYCTKNDTCQINKE